MTADDKIKPEEKPLMIPKAEWRENPCEPSNDKMAERKFANRMAALSYFRPYLAAMAGPIEMSKATEINM